MGLKKLSPEMILSRRPKVLDVSQFGPCPQCKQWLLLKYIKVHYKKCSKNQNVPNRMLIVQAQVLSGVINAKQSVIAPRSFHKNVEWLNRKHCKKDPLIVALGEIWLRRSKENREKNLAHRIRISETLPLDRKSYLTHAI